MFVIASERSERGNLKLSGDCSPALRAGASVVATYAPRNDLRTMKILSIDHVQIAMPSGEEDRARAFYLNVLGFTEIPKPAELAKRGGAWFQNVPTAVELPLGTVRLHLGVEQEFRPARKAHPAFIVDELDALITKAENAGYETDTSQPSLDGYKRAHVFDPFGNRIELMQKL